MDNGHYYQYAFSRADGRVDASEPGIDPRFNVEWIPVGSIAAVASRVGLDQFDVAKLEGRTPEDVAWLNQVAVRHSDIVRQAARSSPVLPLRLGTIFQSKDSMLAALTRCQKAVADFLRTLGDRQEWAAKVYVMEDAITSAAGIGASSHQTSATGTEYLQRRGAELRRRRQWQTELQHAVTAVEDQLAARAGRCCRIRPLSSDLTGRHERMVFNAAYLLPAADVESWMVSVEQARGEIQKKGLLLEVTGPWPPYHFCPELAM
jgi:hypothetical protein